MSEREPAFLGPGPGGAARGPLPPVAPVAPPLGGEAWQAGQPPGPEARPPVTRAPAPGRDRAGPTFYVAGFWRRLAGAMVDLVAILPVCLILAWAAGGVAGIHLPPSRHRGLDFWLDLLLGSDPALLGGLGLSLTIGLTYAFIFQATSARTLGMRLLKLRVIDVYGDPPSILRAAARTAAYLAGLATLGLGFIWIGFDSEKRGLHDWLCGTYVVKTTPWR